MSSEIPILLCLNVVSFGATHQPVRYPTTDSKNFDICTVYISTSSLISGMQNILAVPALAIYVSDLPQGQCSRQRIA